MVAVICEERKNYMIFLASEEAVKLWATGKKKISCPLWTEIGKETGKKVSITLDPNKIQGFICYDPQSKPYLESKEIKFVYGINFIDQMINFKEFEGKIYEENDHRKQVFLLVKINEDAAKKFVSEHQKNHKAEMVSFISGSNYWFYLREYALEKLEKDGAIKSGLWNSEDNPTGKTLKLVFNPKAKQQISYRFYTKTIIVTINRTLLDEIKKRKEKVIGTVPTCFFEVSDQMVDLFEKCSWRIMPLSFVMTAAFS